jgi:hypothetical protein
MDTSSEPARARGGREPRMIGQAARSLCDALAAHAVSDITDSSLHTRAYQPLHNLQCPARPVGARYALVNGMQGVQRHI